MISIHAPHTRSDGGRLIHAFDAVLFQSTLLIRGATRPTIYKFVHGKDFNPRSSYEERHGLRAETRARLDFNPRSSYEERPTSSTNEQKSRLFQSTLLIRGATCGFKRPRPNVHISIHAPHTRSDNHPAYYKTGGIISIHAPHTRSDAGGHLLQRNLSHFNPRSSYEERQGPAGFTIRSHGISIHAPHTRSDSSATRQRAPFGNFNPRSSYEERPVQDALRRHRHKISIHAPHTRSD